MRLTRTAPITMRTLVATLALMLVRAPVDSWVGPPDEQLELGVRQVEGGEFDAAVITLDAVVRRLTAAGDPKDRARAYTYLAIAYLGMAQEQSAKARFLDALKAEPGLTLDPKDYPPKVVQFFEQVRAGQASAGAATTAPSPVPAPAVAKATPVPVATPLPKKKGGSKTLLILLGVGGAAGIAAAAAGGGGGGASTTPPPPATTPPQTTLADLSATVTSPQHNANLNCAQSVFATVTLTNRGRSAVSVTGVRRQGSTITGGCNPSQSFTFTPSTSTLGAGSTEVVMSRSIYSGGSGCCYGDCDGRFCEFQETFTVITSVGDVNAGGIGFGVRFRNCEQCRASVSASGSAIDCPSNPAP